MTEGKDTADTRPKLTYFDLRGRAETIRLMLRATRVEFHDHRVVSSEAWSELKLQLPFGRLPLYEATGVYLPESHAISRHLARSFGWLGADAAMDARADATQDALAEAQEDLWRFAWVENYHEIMEPYAATQLEPRLQRLQAWFEHEGPGAPGRGARFWVADAPIHVDFLAFVYLDEIDAFFPKTLKCFETLAAFHRCIRTIPAVADYIASGDRPSVFGMGIRGPKVDRRTPVPAGTRFETPWADPIDL